MAPFNCTSDYDMAFPQQNLSHQNDDAVRGHSGVIQFTAERKSAHTSGSSSRISSSLKRKPSRNSFLAWVAFDRKYAVNIGDIQRRTCPLIGCERLFDDPELMLKHVRECLPLSKGTYRCFDCHNEEKIGKYHTTDRHNVNQSKDRFATVAKSLRRAKQLFSRRISKYQPQNNQFVDVVDTEAPALNSESSWPPHELETNWYGNPVELSGASFAVELFDDSIYLSGAQVFQRGMLTELGSGQDTLHVVPQYATAALEACDDPASSAQDQDRQRQQDSTLETASHYPNTDEGEWHGTRSFNNRVALPSTHEVYEGHHQTPQRIVSPEIYRWTAVDELVSPMSPNACQQPHCHTSNSWRTDSSPDVSSNSPASVPSICSTESSISTRDNSMSSFDLSNPSLRDCHSPTTPFFEILGSDLIYSEPEELEAPPLSNKGNDEPVSSEPRPRYFAHNSFAFGNNTISPPPWTFKPTTQLAEDTTPPHCYIIPFSLSSPNSDHSPQPSTVTTAGPKHRCVCGFEPSGKEQNKHSNLKRHKKTCRQCTRSYNPYICNYPHCGLRYNRSDNLLAHQRLKKHSSVFEVRVPVSPPLSEPDCSAVEVVNWNAHPKRRRIEVVREEA